MYQYYKAWQYGPPPHWIQTAVTPITAGALKAGPSYEVRPRILPHYYLVWLTAGHGMLQCADQNIPIQGGDLFLLFPNSVHAYQTDPHDLLEMFWIGFSGVSARKMVESAGFTPDSPVCTIAEKPDLTEALKLLSQISQEDTLSSYLDACGKLLSVFSHLISPVCVLPSASDHNRFSALATIAHNYINTHYPEPISVTKLSQQLGVSRVTLTNLFHAELGQSPAEYIQYVRMKHAVSLLSHTDLPIGEIAGKVGFEDPLYFSRVFSKNYGVPPSRFRALSRFANNHPF